MNVLCCEDFLFNLQDNSRSDYYIGTMVDFALAMMSKLDTISKYSFNQFRLRVGT